MKLIPSLLAFPRENWEKDLPILIQHGYTTVHFDVMDEETVHNTAFTHGDLHFLEQYPIKVRVHLMVQKPWEVCRDFTLPNVTSITFECSHLSDIEIQKTITILQKLKIPGGIAIHPDFNNYEKWLPQSQIITIMGVKPGHGGQVLIPETIGKLKIIAALRGEYHWPFQIEFDGGVNATTISQLIPGPDLVVSGSYLYQKLMH